jgi:signal transduction histidine kinase
VFGKKIEIVSDVNSALKITAYVLPPKEVLIFVLILNFIQIVSTVMILGYARQLGQNDMNLYASFVELARSTAHDLRAPLTLMQAVGRRMGDVNPEMADLLKRAVDRANNICEQLLVKSRSLNESIVAKTEGSIRPEETDAMTGNDILEILRIEVENAGVLPVKFDENKFTKFVGNKFQGQARELQRILANLIKNAVEADVKNKGVEVICEIVKARWRPWKFVISITNKSGRLPPEVAKQFGKKPITFGKENGNGLGLYTSVKLIKQWGGAMQFKLPADDGTTISVSLVGIQ